MWYNRLLTPPLGFKQMNLQRVTVEKYGKQLGGGQWWFQIFLTFTPIWGKICNLTNIFQMGLSNHQLEYHWLCQMDWCFTVSGLRFDVLSNSSQRPLQFLMVSLHARQGWKQKQFSAGACFFIHHWRLTAGIKQKYTQLKRISIWTTSPWLWGSNIFIFKGGMLWYWSS